MGDEGFILIAVLIGAYILIMPLVAFIIANGASGKIKNLQADVERLKIQLEGQEAPATKPKAAAQVTVAAEAIPEPAKSKEPWVPPEEKAVVKASKEPAVPKEPKGPTFFDRMAANFKENWIIWLAGISLALGGLFIVQYGLERGYLGPVARVLCALGFGAALLAVAEYLRRKPNMGMEGWFTVPVALAAGGVSSLYGAVVSAHVLYDLTSQMVGFASMVLVSFLAVGAGLIYGPVLAVIGILGAFISPAIVSTGEGHTVMYLYFLSVLVAALTVERMRRWIWLSALAVIFTLIAGFNLNDAIPDQPYLALYIIGVILAVTTIPAFGIWPKWDQAEMINEKTLGNISTHYPTILTVATAIAGTVLLSITATDSLILWQTALLTFLGLTAWAIFWCVRAQNLDQLAIIFAGGLIFIATAGNPLMHYRYHNTLEYRDTLDLAPHLTMLHTILALLAVLFMLASFWRTPRSVRPLFWVASGAIAPVLIYFLSYANWHEIAPISDRAWTFAAILLAVFLMGSALLMLRSNIRQRRTGSDLYFAGMLVATSFAAYMTIEIDYLAHIAALLSLGALALVIRFKFRWTGYLITVFVAASTSLVVFDLFPVYSLQEPVIWVIAIFGVVAGLLVAGYMMAKRADQPNRIILFETAILLTVALLVCALIARVASGGRWELDYMAIGLYATVWTMMAGVQFKRMMIDDRLTVLRKYLGYGYSALALGALALAIILSPFFTSKISGIFPIDTVMVAFALPTLAAYGLYHFKLLPDFITAKIAYGFTGAMAAFITIMEIRRFWHGNNIRLYKGTEVGELYTYTMMLLAATVITVMLAITRKNPALRKTGLGLAALTAAKVFLWDTAGMQGLTRATVFIVLGLTLAGVGWLLQTSQTGDVGKKPPK